MFLCKVDFFICICMPAETTVQKRYECNQFTAKRQCINSPVESQDFSCGRGGGS